jgi:general secretion pathway protein L
MSRTAPEIRFVHLEAPRGVSRGVAPGLASGGHIALVPGEDAPLLALHLPSGLLGAAREQVAWRQVQDQLSVTPKQVEMRPYSGANTDTSWTRVVVAGADVTAQWRVRLQPGCRALLPDYLALPAAADLWVLQVQDDQLRARLGRWDGFTAELDLAELMLAQLLADADIAQPRAVLLLRGHLSPGLQERLAEYDIPVVSEVAALARLGLPPPLVLGHGELSVDLRRDARAARRQLRRQLWPWAAALLAAGLLALVWGSGEALKIRQLQRDQARVVGHTETLVRQHFVPAGPVLDVRLQVARALTERQAQGAAGAARLSPLLLIGQVAEVMVRQQAQVEGLMYDQSQGLVMTLRLETFTALDQLVTALDQIGIAAEPRLARVLEVGDETGAEADDGIRAELHLQVKQTGQVKQAGQGEGQ